MPSRNIVRQYDTDSYYHVYNRGVAKAVIFHEPMDFIYMLHLFKRHLDPHDKSMNNLREPYPKYYTYIDLMAYCLMPNHFHLLIFQKDNLKGITKFMRSVATAYSMYYNKKYKRVGPLFQSKFKARKIVSEGDLLNIARYIHLNPASYLEYPWSSLPYYCGAKNAIWVKHTQITHLIGEDYINYLKKVGP